jgi:hypothetical protein
MRCAARGDVGVAGGLGLPTGFTICQPDFNEAGLFS